jgi:putative nucleotidyltransferase with HDIG domain
MTSSSVPLEKGKRNTTPQELVSGVIRLVSLPEVCIRVNEMLEDPNITASDLGKVIAQDTGLTARLLKIVNSSFYGFPSRIETVTRAVTVIGLRELRGLVLAASAVEAFSKIPNDVLNMVNFWRHSVYCGVVAQQLAERCRVLHSERLFVAGLLHDIGKLIMSHKIPDTVKRILDIKETDSRTDEEIENEVLGFSHADVGGELMRFWQMPESLYNTVRYHHHPEQAEASELEVCVIHIANAMTLLAESNPEENEEVETGVHDYAWKITGLDESVMESVFEDAAGMFTEALEAIIPRSYQPL